jgi:Zn-dependent protease
VFNLSLPELARIIPAILVGLTVHELSHAGVALLLGDDTARSQGRLTLNPIKHIDPVGFILLLLVGFGWAKPVVINPEKLRRPRRDDTLIALAGPAANLLFALLLVLLLRLFLFLIIRIAPNITVKALEAIVLVFVSFVTINIALAVFNLLPVPPLDGSHLVTNLLSLHSGAISAGFYRYGSLALLAIIVLDRLVEVDLLPIEGVILAIYNILLRLVGLA